MYLFMSQSQASEDMSKPVRIEVEFCGSCGYAKEFNELADYLKKNKPEFLVNGFEGRRASFEVKVNGQLVHSKLSTLAYPNYDDLIKIGEEVAEGKEARTCQQRPITNCILM